LRARNRTTQPRARDRGLDQAFGFHRLGELPDEWHSLIASLGNSDREMLDAPAAVEHARAGQFFRHLEQACLVGRIGVEAAG